MSASRFDPLTVSVCAAEAVPEQVVKAVSGPVSVMDGAEPTVTVTVVVFTHDGVPAVVPVTVYVVVEVGLAVTVAPLVALNPVAGDHVYVLAPEAVRLTLPAKAIEGAAGVTTTVGSAWLVNTTSSTEAAQLALVTDQRSVALVPTGTPDTVEDAKLAPAIVAVPLITVQLPVPMVGTLAASVKSPLLHLDWSGPALAAVGNAWTVAALIASVCVVALVLLAPTFPLAPLTASDFNRTYTVVADTEVPFFGMMTVPAYPDPLLSDTS